MLGSTAARTELACRLCTQNLCYAITCDHDSRATCKHGMGTRVSKGAGLAHTHRDHRHSAECRLQDLRPREIVQWGNRPLLALPVEIPRVLAPAYMAPDAIQYEFSCRLP